MTSPTITAVCCTYGRVKRLENAIAQFLAQDYEHKHLVILNTFPDQKLSLKFPLPGTDTDSWQIDVVNCDSRPATMGDARNKAIAFSRGEVIVTWDDDDHYHPSHLSTIARHFSDGIDWVWLDTMFFMEKDAITRIITGSPNVFAFTKRAWCDVGGYKPINTGEDKEFIAAVNTRPGKRIHLTPPEITFGYGWDTGDYHLSGHGFDKADHMTGYAKVEQDVKALALAGRIPTGIVHLKPRLLFDAERHMRDWVEINNHSAKTAGGDVCIIELGRFGDIINILPVALHIHNTFSAPYFMVAREFASVLDGVSYVKPLVVDFKQDQVLAAIAQAQRRFKNVLVTQVWGDQWEPQRQCASYNRESWRLAGFAHKFDDASWKPLFDRRDSDRETVLLTRACPHALGCRLLVNVTHGVSSPYPHGALLLAGIAATFGHIFHIINIAQLKLERLYDVLALMEEAAALVSIDTVHLHLSAAVECPTFAICNDKPWLGTEVRHANHVRFTYADSVETILASMKKELGL